MDKKNKIFKINLILTAFALILSFLFVFSTAIQKKDDKRKKTTTALLNPKYCETMNRIEIYSIDGKILLDKTKNIWLIKASDSDCQIPANSSFVSDFIKALSKIVDLYQIGQLNQKNSDNFFPLEQCVIIKYFYTESDFQTLYFGRYDFSQTYRYFHTEKNTNVYEIPTFLDKYLQTSYSVWSEGNLISQNVSGQIKADDIQRISCASKDIELNKILTSSTKDFKSKKENLLELRHGQNVQKDEINLINDDLLSLKLILELGNKSEISMKFYKITEENEEFYLIEEIFNQSETFYYKCSLWTYNKIKEIIL